jgi:hypothetical protein
MMTKKALLVGINYPGTSHALNGCVNDVILMSEVLTKHFGFTAKNKRMLTDRSATTRNILNRLGWLVQGAKPGDVLYFHYSGHGSQMVDTKYDLDDEPDGLDEIICPVDLNWRDKVVKDDDLKRIFDRVPDGVNLTVMLDCCHSGGGIDSSYQYQSMGSANADHDSFSPNKSRLLPMPADIGNRALGLDLKPRTRKVQSVKDRDVGVMISGCQSHQTSADAWIHNKYMGAATYYLVEALQQYKFDTSYKAIVDYMNAKLKRNRYTQRPELNGAEVLHGKRFLQPLV